MKKLRSSKHLAFWVHIFLLFECFCTWKVQLGPWFLDGVERTVDEFIAKWQHWFLNFELKIPWWDYSYGHVLGPYFSRNYDISGLFWHGWPSLVNYHSLQPFWSILAHTQGSQCVIYKSSLKSLARLFTLWKQTKQRFTTFVRLISTRFTTIEFLKHQKHQNSWQVAQIKDYSQG